MGRVAGQIALEFWAFVPTIKNKNNQSHRSRTENLQYRSIVGEFRHGHGVMMRLLENVLRIIQIGGKQLILA